MLFINMVHVFNPSPKVFLCLALMITNYQIRLLYVWLLKYINIHLLIPTYNIYVMFNIFIFFSYISAFYPLDNLPNKQEYYLSSK
jgi:hypothetical protein